MMKKITLHKIEITLQDPIESKVEWVNYNDYELQLQAAWLSLSDSDSPLNPRLVGAPGLGKTTLARAVGQRMGRDVYLFQCTADTRPEDLLITPVLSAERQVEYRASSLVTAMIRGGLLVLDEANRMPERSWASLAPLLDDRRWIDSAVAAIRVHAHPAFRLCATMNDDSSVYELPSYIHSRLKPKISITPPPWKVQKAIVRAKCPQLDKDLLHTIFNDIKTREKNGNIPSSRDILTLAQYTQKLRSAGFTNAFEHAKKQVLPDELEEHDSDEEDFEL